MSYYSKANLGIVEYRDLTSFVIADIPGIHWRRAEGKGLGILVFLRHIERNSTLLLYFGDSQGYFAKKYEFLLRWASQNIIQSCWTRQIWEQFLSRICWHERAYSEMRLERNKDLRDIHICFISSVAQMGLVRTTKGQYYGAMPIMISFIFLNR